MRFRVLILSVCTLFLSSGIYADDTGKQLSVIETFARPVSAWLAAGSLIPVDEENIRTPRPIPYSSMDLVQSDPAGKIILVRSVSFGTLAYSFYNTEGILLDSFEQSWDADLPLPAVVIDPRSSSVVLLDMIGRLEQRHFDGTLHWKKELIRDPVFSYENTFFLSFDSGGHIIAAISLPVSESESGFTSHVFRLDTRGDVEHTFSRRKAKILNFAVTEQNQSGLMIKNQAEGSTGSEIETLILNADLDLLSGYPVAFRQLCAAGPEMLLISGKSDLQAVNPETGRLLWKHEAESGKRILAHTSFDSSANRIRVVSGIAAYEKGKLLFNDPVVLTLTPGSKRISRVELGSRTLLPHAVYAPGSRTLHLGTSSQLLELEIR